MILNKLKTIKQKMKKSPLLAKIKFEPTFFRFFGGLSFRFRFKARRTEGGFGGNSGRRVNRPQNQFGFFKYTPPTPKKHGNPVFFRGWWALEDLNLRPRRCERRALTTAPSAQTKARSYQSKSRAGLQASAGQNGQTWPGGN